MKNLIVIVLMICALSVKVPVQALDNIKSIPAELKGIESLINKGLKDFKVPGASVCIVKDGKIVYMKGFGYRDLENKLEVTPETVFAIGSDSKAFTATVAGILVDEGLLDFDKPVIRYLPTFKMYNGYTTVNVTMRDLLTHRTGVSRNDFLLSDTPLSREELVAKIQYLKPAAPFRYTWIYNNFMYTAAGYITGYISNKTWEELVKEKILVPLNMTSTYFSFKDCEKLANRALPYNSTDTGIEKTTYESSNSYGPAGSISSNVLDLSKWVIMNLNKGVYRGNQIVSENILSDIQSSQILLSSDVTYPEIKNVAYGMGWGSGIYNNHRMIFHDGEIRGFHASIIMLPDDNIGFVTLSNNTTTLPYAINMSLVDRMMHFKRLSWLDKAQEKAKLAKEAAAKENLKLENNRVSGTKPSHSLEDYCGIYKNKAIGNVNISLNDAQQLVFTYNKITIPMEHYHYDYFKCTDGDFDFLVQFKINDKGQIYKIMIPFEPTIKPYKFTKTTSESKSKE